MDHSRAIGTAGPRSQGSLTAIECDFVNGLIDYALGPRTEQAPTNIIQQRLLILLMRFSLWNG
jgi:hypothetical protein